MRIHLCYNRLAILIILVCFLVSCNNNKKNDNTEEIVTDTLLEQSVVNNIPSTEIISELPKWLPGEYPRIGIFFGHGYTTKENLTPILNELEKEFGLASENGLIIPFEFPVEYITGKPIRVAYIKETLKDYKLNGLIILCAPDRTHYALAELQDYGIEYPIYSVFPQDDILGIEAESTFVLDFEEKTQEVTETLREEEKQFSGNITNILIPLIRSMKVKTGKSIVPDTPSEIASLLEKEYKKIDDSCVVKVYSDPDTGLRSRNHFVLEVSQ